VPAPLIFRGTLQQQHLRALFACGKRSAQRRVAAANDNHVVVLLRAHNPPVRKTLATESHGNTRTGPKHQALSFGVTPRYPPSPPIRGVGSLEASRRFLTNFRALFRA